MKLLPLCLGPIARCTSEAGTRFALGGVHLILKDDKFIAEATDTYIALRVTGPYVMPEDEYPPHLNMQNAPNDSKEALIPAETWTKAFAMGKKMNKKEKNRKALAVRLGKELATFGATALDSYPIEQTRLIEGRFPSLDLVLEKVAKNEYDFKGSVNIDAMRMAQLMSVIDDVLDIQPKKGKRIDSLVTMTLKSHTKPILLNAENAETGIKIEGLVMPLAD